MEKYDKFQFEFFKGKGPYCIHFYNLSALHNLTSGRHLLNIKQIKAVKMQHFQNTGII